ncbi:hypothetical protein ACFLV6_03525 [Chloroflexota bacterium]
MANTDGAFELRLFHSLPPPAESVCSLKAWTGGYGDTLEATWPLVVLFY